MTDDPKVRPFDSDPVRDAVRRYFDWFPELGMACRSDALTAALFKQLERALVQADIAMQDEGLDEAARRRVVTCALYGSVDEDAALGRMRAAQAEVERLSATIMSGRLAPDGWARPFGDGAK